MSMPAAHRAVPAVHRLDEGFLSSESRGLFVGISRLRDPLFTEIPFAVDDAVDLAHLFAFELDLLTAPGLVLALSGEPRKEASMERLRELVEEGATRTEANQTDIYLQLDYLRRQTTQRGLLIVTLAAHGFSDQGGDFIVAADSLKQRIKRTGVKVDELFDDIARAPAPRRLVLIDSCRERLTNDTRAIRGANALGERFAAAIQAAEGQVVLAGATLGGFAYDDLQRGNGVFTGAVLDGLRGEASPDERGFITVHSLAELVNERVVQWVRENRPDHARISRGIARRIEGAAAQMPLAVEPGRFRQIAELAKRRDVAQSKLKENIGEIITGALYDEITSALSGEDLDKRHEELLEEVEALDETPRLQRNLIAFFREHWATETLPQHDRLYPDDSGRREPVEAKRKQHAQTVREKHGRAETKELAQPQRKKNAQTERKEHPQPERERRTQARSKGRVVVFLSVLVLVFAVWRGVQPPSTGIAVEPRETTNHGADWDNVLRLKEELDSKRQMLQTQHTSALEAEVLALSKEFATALVDFINGQGIMEGTKFTGVQRTAFDMKAEEDILIAQEYIDRGGDYQRAIEIYNNSLNIDPDSKLLQEALSQALALRYMSKERFSKVKKGMTESEVRKLIGTPKASNVREFEQAVLGWFYPKAPTADGTQTAAGVFFQKRDGVYKVYKADFDAISG